MRGPLLALCFIALSLGWLVFFGEGVRLADWNATILFLGATALFYWTFRSGQTPPRLPGWQAFALWALPVYAVLQLVPLPAAMLEGLSPARSLITESLGGVIPSLTLAPISVAPAASLFGLFSLLGYLTTFSLLRDIGWRIGESHPWIAVAPLAAIATLESAIGLGQWLGGPPNMPLRGTFSNSEHFSGLLEIALPFTLIFGFISFRRHQMQEVPILRPALLAASAWGASLLLLLALFHSSSEIARVVVAASLFILLAFAVIPLLKTKQLRRYAAAGAVACAIVAFLVIAPPADLAASLSKLGGGDQSGAKLAIWSNSASLFGEFRWFGTGLGGFESTFTKYQGSTDLNRIQNPRSDVLALLIEFGVVGFLFVCAALAGIVKPAIMGTLHLASEPKRLLAASITASFFAVLLRSCLDSSLSIPALAMAFAWLAGLSQSSGLE